MGKLIPKHQNGKYIVLSGDTLSSIANKYNLNYKDIAASNGIANPNLIIVGDELDLDIPTLRKNSLNGIQGKYIEDYQDLKTGVKSKYDYFLGNNGELFYKLKGSTEWIDNSNNERAKQNLNNFLNNKRNNLKRVAVAPRRPTSTFQQQVEQKRKTLNNSTTRRTPSNDQQNEIIIDNFTYNGVASKNDYKLVGNKTYKRVKGTLNWIDISNDKLSRRNLEEFLNNQLPTPKPPQTQAPQITELLLGNRTYAPFRTMLDYMQYNAAKYEKEHPKPALTRNTHDMDFVSSPGMMGIHVPTYGFERTQLAVSDLAQKAYNYYQRHHNNEEHELPIEMEEGDYKINYNGFSLPAQSLQHRSADRYNSSLQVINYDPSTFTFGTRNRGQYPEGVDNVTLTTFNPFYEQNNPILNKYHSFIGISPEGRLKVSTNLLDFEGAGWKISPTYSNIITGFRRNDDGSLYLGYDYKKGTNHPGNPKNKVAYYYGVSDDGTTQFDNGLLNILTAYKDDKGNYSTSKYGDISGGKALFATEDGQMRLISGSIDQVVAGFEEFQKQNPGKQIRMYTLDNGSYSKVLLKNQGQYFTQNDWVNYDYLNDSGGHVVYITGNASQQLLFPSDTAYYLIDNPNYSGIAKSGDRLTSAGHPLTRNPRGVVLHQTATNQKAPGRAALATFQQYGTGANVVIDANGNRTVLADPDRVTYHAGASLYTDPYTGDVLENLDDYFSGIEFTGTKNDLITDAQVLSAIEYLRPIIQLYKIYPRNLVTHEQIREAYRNKYGKRSAEHKWDMNPESYKKLREAILKEIYYLKSGGKLKLIPRYLIQK